MKKKTIRIQSSFAKGRERSESREITQPFATAIIDPDWPYTVAPGMKNIGDVKDAHRKGKLSGFTRNRDSKQNQYRSKHPLSIEELKRLPVGDVVGCYIMLWTVGPFLINGAAAEILKAWGFEPASIVTWAKYDLRNRHGYGGVGFWFLGNAEFCIVAKRPGMPSIRTGLSSLFIERKGAHSTKPSNIHQICELRFPGPYLEIFGRSNRDGWLVVGDEAPCDGSDIRKTLKDISGGDFARLQLDKRMDNRARQGVDRISNRARQTQRQSRQSSPTLRDHDMDGDDLCPRLF